MDPVAHRLAPEVGLQPIERWITEKEDRDGEPLEAEIEANSKPLARSVLPARLGAGLAVDHRMDRPVVAVVEAFMAIAPPVNTRPGLYKHAGSGRRRSWQTAHRPRPADSHHGGSKGLNRRDKRAQINEPRRYLKHPIG